MADNKGRRSRGPNAERRASTHDKILAAAVRCLNDVGYARTSSVRVAAQADVARDSLLHTWHRALERARGWVEA